MIQPRKKIGCGTYGSVYVIDESRVLKTSNTTFKGSVCAGLVREFVCIQSLPPHPHVAAALQTWINDDKGYILMPNYGENLLTKLRREGGLPMMDLLFILRDAARGLHHMHVNGWLHRDVKPENIFLSTKGAIVGDFSLARFGVSDADITASAATGSTRVCTLWTRPPELVHADLKSCSVATYGPEVDVFSLGAVALAMMNGDHVLGKTFPRHAGISEEESYLTGFLNLMGADADVKVLYDIPRAQLFQPVKTAPSRLIAYTKTRDALAQRVVVLIASMLHPIAKMRCKLPQLLAELDKILTGKQSFPTYVLSDRADDTYPPVSVPEHVIERRRRVAPSIAFWKEAVATQLPYTLACQGLYILRIVDSQPDALLMCLRMLQRFTSIKFDASTEVLLILPFFRMSPEITWATDLASKAGPFLSSALACELALGEWDTIDEVVFRCIETKAPTCLEMEGASVFFDAYPGKWGSQQSVRKSWCRLS